MDLLVVAKEPVPGLVKTRLCPPCSGEEAAAVAEAALVDTLTAALASRADRVVLSLAGQPGPWCPEGVEVVDQGSGSFADRLATTWKAARGPALQVGMDTPQVTSADLDHALDALLDSATDAVLGLADDGGWWAIGFRSPRPDAFDGIPTSQADTGRRQRERLDEMGLRTTMLPSQRDVDTWEDAMAVAREHPSTRFGQLVAALAGATP